MWSVRPYGGLASRVSGCAFIRAEYNHYHRCKHTIAVGLWKKEICVPIRFSTETVGKRKASAGASLHKRSKCLVIDA